MKLRNLETKGKMLKLTKIETLLNIYKISPYLSYSYCICKSIDQLSGHFETIYLITFKYISHAFFII